MIGPIPTGFITSAEVSAVIHRGLSVKLPDGRKGKIAIVDDAGQVIDASPEVAREVFNVSIACYKNMWIGKGHLRVFLTPPPGIGSETAA